MLFGFADPALISLQNLKLDKKMLFIGDDLHLSFELIIKEKFYKLAFLISTFLIHST